MSRGSTPPTQAGTGDGSADVATQEQLDPLSSALTPPLRVLVTGAAGFLGSHFLPRLASRGHFVRATYRSESGPGRDAMPGADWRRADVTDPGSLRELARECDAVVHLAGSSSRADGPSLEAIHAAGTRNVIAAAAACDVRRFVFVSALGASPAGGEFFRSKFQAEDAVMSSGLEYVILRPSVAYGPGDHFTTALARLLRALPVFPMLGDGTFRIQPVAVEDLADAMTQSVERTDLCRGLFEVAGPEALSFLRVVRTVGEAIGCSRPVVPLPEPIAPVAAWLAGQLSWPTPFTPEQLDILRSGSVLSGEDNPLRSVFHVKPLPFRDAIQDYLTRGTAGPGKVRGRGSEPA